MQLSVKDTAKILNVSEKTIYRWIKQQVLPVYQINEQYRFNRSELLEWATSRRIQVSPEIFQEVEHSKTPLPSLLEALKKGGISYRVGGNDKPTVLRAIVDLLNLPVFIGVLFCDSETQSSPISFNATLEVLTKKGFLHTAISVNTEYAKKMHEEYYNLGPQSMQAGPAVGRKYLSRAMFDNIQKYVEYFRGHFGPLFHAKIKQ